MTEPGERERLDIFGRARSKDCETQSSSRMTTLIRLPSSEVVLTQIGVIRPSHDRGVPTVLGEDLEQTPAATAETQVEHPDRPSNGVLGIWQRIT